MAKNFGFIQFKYCLLLIQRQTPNITVTYYIMNCLANHLALLYLKLILSELTNPQWDKTSFCLSPVILYSQPVILTILTILTLSYSSYQVNYVKTL